MDLKSTLIAWEPRVLSILRIVAAVLFFEHGTQKIFGIPTPKMTPEMFSLPWVAGWMEIVGGLLLIIGLFTRPVAFLLSGQMAFAYFIAHAPQSTFPALTAATPRSCSASSSFISCSPAAAPGASMPRATH